MVVICDVILFILWYFRLFIDYVYINKVVLGIGKCYGMVVYNNGVLYCWCGWIIGRVYVLFSIC